MFLKGHPCTNRYWYLIAEFRGPGVHHNFDDNDSGNDYDNDSSSKGKSFGIGGYRGRIIFLGDGTEVLTDSDDTEMFDNTEEDKDVANQVSKGSSSGIITQNESDNSQEVIGSPVTPEKLDPNMELGGKAAGAGPSEGFKKDEKKQA